MRFTPEEINILEPGEIFVFGSNLSGRHGAGAAKTAMRFGAVYGQGKGLQGCTYAIPTKNASITETLPLYRIETYITEFLEFAKQNPQYTFLMTKIGCGLAGLSIKDIASLFYSLPIPENVILPKEFWRKLPNENT